MTYRLRTTFLGRSLIPLNPLHLRDGGGGFHSIVLKNNSGRRYLSSPTFLWTEMWHRVLLSCKTDEKILCVSRWKKNKEIGCSQKHFYSTQSFSVKIPSCLKWSNYINFIELWGLKYDAYKTLSAWYLMLYSWKLIEFLKSSPQNYEGCKNISVKLTILWPFDSLLTTISSRKIFHSLIVNPIRPSSTFSPFTL